VIQCRSDGIYSLIYIDRYRYIAGTMNWLCEGFGCFSLCNIFDFLPQLRYSIILWNLYKILVGI
jgi:hypothetical protein